MGKKADVVQSVPEVTESELAATYSATTNSGKPLTKLSTEEKPEKKTVIVRSFISKLTLVKSYESNLLLAEEQALNFLGDQTHHPVISCFRELTQKDLNKIIGSNNFKHQVNTLEKSIILLGMVDYIIAAVNNPLYQDSFSKRFSTTAPACLQVIMMDFKTTIKHWGISESDVLNKRATLILSYLRRLTRLITWPDFQRNFEAELDSIENEIAREWIKKGWVSKHTNNKSVSAEDKSALGKIDLNLDVKDEKNKSSAKKGKNDHSHSQSKTVSNRKPSNGNIKRASTKELCSDGGPTKKLKIDSAAPMHRPADASAADAAIWPASESANSETKNRPFWRFGSRCSLV